MVATEQDNAAYVDSLWQKYRRQRTIDTRNQLAEYYLPLVKMVAGRLAISLPSHVDKEDLLSSGFFGLLDAIDRYDFQRKNKFETYAGVRVRGAMLDYLRSKDWVPVTMRQKIRRYEQAVYDLENELGRPAKDEELAERLNISLGELSDLVAQLNSSTVVPLEEYLRTDGSESPEMSPVESIELRELQDTLAQAIDRLKKKKKLVISLYYYEDLTLREISLIMHLTEARISQMHTKAVFRLRGYLARMKADLL